MTIKNKNDANLSSGMCQAAIDDATEIMAQIKSIEDCYLPTWWTSKLAVASAYLNSLRDYVTYNRDDIMEESEEMSKPEMDDQEDEVEIDDDMIDMADEMLPPSARMIRNAAKAG